MTDNDREQVALFRYGLIAPILNGQVTNQSDYLAKICAQKHQVPYYGLKEFVPKTVSKWLQAYRKAGFEALKPLRRSDRGHNRKLTPELKDRLLNLRREHRHLSVTLFYDQLIYNGHILPTDVSYATLYRIFKMEGLVGKEPINIPERKRFAYDQVNILWQGDTAIGPYLKLSGKKVKTFLFAFIDDCSRIIPFAMFLVSEKFHSVQKVLSEAILRRGVPRLLYLDNGKIYRSDQLSLACASLGITLIHTQPYDPQSKGKIERFFKTVRERFLPLLTEEDLTSLDSLNNKFWHWLEIDYHRKVHSAIGMTPLDKFMSQISQVKTLDNPDFLKDIFMKREYRKVKHDATISVNNTLYEVAPQFVGQKVEIRYDQDHPDEVFIYSDNRCIDRAKRVSFSDNTRVKRQRNNEETTISFHKMEQIKKGVNQDV